MPRLWTQVSGRTDPDRERIVLLHGFTQTARSWHRIAAALEPAAEVVAFDLPGHGGSSEVSADLGETAALVAASVGRAVLIGYSMGARVALHVALAHPEAVSGLVLIGGTGGIDSAEERRERRDADERLAQQLEHDGVDAFLGTWLAGPLFATFTPDPQDLAARKTNTAAGLAMSLRRSGTGSQEPLWERLPGLPVPALVMVGARDAKFTQIGTRLVSAIGGRASMSVVPDAGHAAHLENPVAFLALLRHGLDRLRSADRSGQPAG